MTAEEDLPVTADSDLPARSDDRTWLDELYRWRWWLLGGSIVLLGGYIYLGMPGLVLVGVFASTALLASLVAFPVSLLHVLLNERLPEQRALVVLDPRPAEVDLSVRFFDPEEFRAIDMRWGELHRLAGTSVPAWLCLSYDEEEHAAHGTHRSVLPPDELEATLWKTDEIYGELEEEAAKVSKLQSIGRTLVRRGVTQLHAEDTARLAEFELGTDSFGEAWERVRPEKPESVTRDQEEREEETDDDGLLDDGHADEEQARDLLDDLLGGTETSGVADD
ncbi:hypothetical protein [Haladaptatus sp. CMAA 1911]|uniref:hypothetical protein n=1 Tax=unclassified Haladaptatus TaxID=2622732 RepID=UPI0037548621